jgi:hypothetical protein
MKKFLVAFAALLGLLGLTGTASAGNFTISYTGTVTLAVDGNTWTNLPGEVGRKVSGKISFNNYTSTSGDYTLYDSADISFTAAGAPTVYSLNSPDGYIALSNYSDGTVRAAFGAGPGPADTEIVLFWGPGAPLVSLATFPANDVAAAAFFGTPMFAHGAAFKPGWPIAYAFSVDSFKVATTPIPASLWLFVSALGGLGWFGWRRRALPAAA